MSKVKLQSSDDHEFEVDFELIKKSVTLKNMLEDIGEGEDMPIPLPNITANILEKVIEYLEHHKNDPSPNDDDENKEEKEEKEEKKDDKRTDNIDEWDTNFMKVDQATIFELILASNYLDIKPLLDLGCKTVANMIKGKTPEEIRKTFNIKNDFTPEEETAVRKDNEWITEK